MSTESLTIATPLAISAWVCVAASAGIIFSLGILHLGLTFHGTSFAPRDRALLAQMKHAYPDITRQTTVWRAYVGFNASHSLGAVMFGVFYGDLAIAHGSVLFGSSFLSLFGLFCLICYAVLARFYWFSRPFQAIVAATILYGVGLIFALAAT